MANGEIKRDINASVEKLQSWIRQELKNKSSVPRLSDMVLYAKTNIKEPKLTKQQITSVARLNKHYQMVMPQQRIVKRSRKYRPVITSSLGYFHGDLGFFSINDKYPTPPSFRAGFLVLVDVLSRYVYLQVLIKNRQADAIIKALEKIFQRHKQKHAHPIRAISFDQENSVMSKQVQAYLKKHYIQFKPFKFTSSKAKFAENMIKIVRQKMDILEKETEYRRPWWTMLDEIETMLNHQPIMINNQMTSFTPAQINEENVLQFLDQLQNKSPAHYFGQFNIDPGLVKFKFSIGDIVKVKTIIVSSQVLGEKKSTHQLTKEDFVIVYRQPYIRRDLTIGILYTCKELDASEGLHQFDESELSISEPTWS